MTSIKTRPLTKDDYLTYKDIRLEMLRDNPESFGKDFDKACNDSDNDWIALMEQGNIQGAFSNNKLIAVAGVFFNPDKKQQHKASIWGVFVKPEFRGLNISSQLIKEIISKFPDSIEQAIIHVSANNKSAYHIYQKLGFKTFGQELKARIVNGAYFDEYHMKKFLK